MPFYFEVLRAREHTPIPYPFAIFTFGFVIEFIRELGGMLAATLLQLLITSYYGLDGF